MCFPKRSASTCSISAMECRPNTAGWADEGAGGSENARDRRAARWSQIPFIPCTRGPVSAQQIEQKQAAYGKWVWSVIPAEDKEAGRVCRSQAAELRVPPSCCGFEGRGWRAQIQIAPAEKAASISVFVLLDWAVSSLRVPVCISFSTCSFPRLPCPIFLCVSIVPSWYSLYEDEMNF